MSSEELKLCPFCGGDVSFHKDEECPGCHLIQCGQCRAFFDFATGADPGNDCASVDALRAAIAPMWNARAKLAAIQGGMGEADKHRAQPEVAENTGSHAMAKNQLSRQEQAVARDVEGVAAPCEASPGNDIFAWATFDGEGSYDLRLFDGNESYRDDFRRNNPRHHPDWVFPLYRNSMTAAMAAEVERLKRENANIRVKWTEYGRELEAERDALAAELAIARRVIGRIGQLCTTPHESKERFIRRVQSVIEWERAAQQDQPK